MKIIEASYSEREKRVKNNTTYKKLDSICKKYGYQLYYAVLYSYGPRVQVVSPRDGYLPEIFFDYDETIGRTGTNAWSIQTTSYGSLKLSEYKKFMEGCTAAYKMVQELAKVDLFKLESADWEKQ